MKQVVTATQMQAIEAASAEAGVPASLLMETAGQRLADAAQSLAGPAGQFLVVCGLGNNGGDGLVAARFLSLAGRNVTVEIVGDPSALQGDPARNLAALKATGAIPRKIADNLVVGPGDVVIDALFGTGLGRPPEGAYGEAISRMNVWRTQGAKIISADVPSGLSSDSGQPYPAVVRADATVAFGQLKVAHVVEPGASLCGEVRVVDIGIPASATKLSGSSRVGLVEEADARARLPERKRDSHKGSYGHVLVIAGSWGKTGAAALSARAALRSGAGLCTVATRPEALVPVLAHSPELMGIELVSDGALGLADLNPLLEAADGKSALVIGPGIPRGPETGRLIGTLLEELECPVVLDADALNAVAEDLNVLAKAKTPLILTPHPGEMARLVGKTIAEVQQQRLALSNELASRLHAIVILKGARTIISNGPTEAYINPTGNPGMASAGMGDVLSGVLGALLGQVEEPLDAALCGTYAHGLAGDLAAAQKGQLGLIASDVIEALGEVWARWKR